MTRKKMSREQEKAMFAKQETGKSYKKDYTTDEKEYIDNTPPTHIPAKVTGKPKFKNGRLVVPKKQQSSSKPKRPKKSSSKRSGTTEKHFREYNVTITYDTGQTETVRVVSKKKKAAKRAATTERKKSEIKRIDTEYVKPSDLTYTVHHRK